MRGIRANSHTSIIYYLIFIIRLISIFLFSWMSLIIWTPLFSNCKETLSSSTSIFLLTSIPFELYTSRLPVVGMLNSTFIFPELGFGETSILKSSTTVLLGLLYTKSLQPSYSS